MLVTFLWNSVSIRKKILGSFLTVGVITVSAILLYLIQFMQQDRQTILEQLDHQLRESFDQYIRFQVETAYTMVDKLEALAGQGVLESETAREVAIHLIRDVRYGLKQSDLTDGYFWADTKEGVNLALYGRTDVEGTNRNDLKDAKGNLLIQDIRREAMAGGGFTDYWFPKLGESVPLPKRGYSLYHQGFDMVVGTGAYTDDIDDIMRAHAENRGAVVRRSISRLMMVGLLGILLVVVASYFIGNTITAQINSVTASLRNIAEGEGDLTRRINIKSKDEIGELARWFNVFVEKIQKIIIVLKDEASSLATSAEELSLTSRQIAANAQEMTTKSSAVASSTELATTNINSISSSAEGMSTSTNSVATAIEEMSASLNEVSRNCQQELQIAQEADTYAKSSKEVMNKLGGSAKSIGKVVKVINDIADQTNLLALNATIEAASAGDAGKGFTVVANEVKELAKQTAQATLEIETQIEEIQRNAVSSVKAIEAVSKVIEEVNTISQTIVSAVEEQSATINEIAQNVSGVSAGAQQVSKNVSQSATGLSEVAYSISGVNDAVAATAKGIAQVKSSAEELAQLSKTLKGVLGQFVV